MGLCLKVRRLLVATLFIFLFPFPVEAVEPAPRISDREIIESLTRIEEGLKALKKEMDNRFELVDSRFEQIDKRFEQIDKRFDSIERQFDRLINIFIGIIASFAGVVAVTIGFAIWDRRTALKPALNRVEKLESVLRKYAEKEPRLAEVLRSLGLL